MTPKQIHSEIICTCKLCQMIINVLLFCRLITKSDPKDLFFSILTHIIDSFFSNHLILHFYSEMPEYADMHFNIMKLLQPNNDLT